MFDKLGKLAYNSDLESLKSSVSEGKKLIAAAVTDKGVETAADAAFKTLADNISNIASSPAGTHVLHDNILLTNGDSKQYQLTFTNGLIMYYYSSGGSSVTSLGQGIYYTVRYCAKSGTGMSDYDYANGSKTACTSMSPYFNYDTAVLTCRTGNYSTADISFWLLEW
mgnify:CR=1 FL=1